MPLTKPKFEPGIVKDDTPLAAEGSWTDCDKIRFHPDKPEVIGGWEQVAATQDPDATVFDPVVFDATVFREGLVASTAMFPGKISGAHAWWDNDGEPHLAWGTTAGLYLMRDSVIYDITPDAFVPEIAATGRSSYGVGNYGEDVYGSKRRVVWSLDNWGENLLACARGGTLYEWTPEDEKALSVANAPDIIEYFFVSPERVVVLLGTSEFGGAILNPMLVRWSDQGDNTAWTPSPTNVAGEFPLAQGARLLTGLVTRAQNLLWSDTALYTMQFTGDVNSVFTIRAVGRGCGIIGPRAKCASDSAVYWASRDNFFAFTGQVPQVIPSKVRREVFDHIFPGEEERMHCGWNTGFQEPWFFYADSRDGTGECSRYAMMNSEGAWAIGTFERCAWVKAGVFPYPIGITSTDNRIFFHEIPDEGDDGGPLEAFIESGFIDVGDGDTLYIIKRIVPDFEDQGPNVAMTFRTRFWPNGTITTRGPYTATTTTNKLDMRVKAREIAVKLESAGVPGSSYWALGAVAFDAQESGEKR